MPAVSTSLGPCQERKSTTCEWALPRDGAIYPSLAALLALLPSSEKTNYALGTRLILTARKKPVTPAKAGIQKCLKLLDPGSRFTRPG